jgi:hypothetical protein
MALTIIFGVNGVGKDTLANAVQKTHPHIALISASRALMKAFGLPVEITADFPIPFEYYRTLEINEPIVNALYDTKFVDILREFKNSGKDGIILHHLCVIKPQLDGTLIYDDDVLRPWFYELFDQFILIRTEPTTIKNRQEQDIQSGKRTRHNLSLRQIEEQVQKSDNQWQELCKQLKQRGLDNYYEIENNEKDLEPAIAKLSSIVSKNK